MLTVHDLLNQKTKPSIGEISLSLYCQFLDDILLKYRFRYEFLDDTVVYVEFQEWVFYHLLGIQHIDNKIQKETFRQNIRDGLDFFEWKKDKKTRKNHIRKYVENLDERVVKGLLITDKDTGEIIEDISYADSFIMS